MFGRKPKENPHSYIAVLPTGTYWADEFGVVTEQVTEGTFHRVVGSDNSRFAEAVLIASMMHSHLARVETQVAMLAEEIRTLGNSMTSEVAGRGRHRGLMVRKADRPLGSAFWSFCGHLGFVLPFVAHMRVTERRPSVQSTD